jgi:hypothetical protein
MLDLVQNKFAVEEWMNFCISETLLSEEVVELIVVSICNDEFDQLLLSPDLQLQKKSRANALNDR